MNVVDPFIDSNVIVYSVDHSEPAKRQISIKLLQTYLDQGTGSVSAQVVQECLNVFTRRLRPRMSAEQAKAFMGSFLVPLWRVSPDSEMYSEALHLHARYQTSFYDSLIIAAAQRLCCRTILSEDLQHDQVFGGVRIVNPFLDA